VSKNHNQQKCPRAEKLRTLDPVRARHLENLVRKALNEVGNLPPEWPAGFFELTSGALAGEEFERPIRGEFPRRDDW
jgi:hypothetical protein